MFLVAGLVLYLTALTLVVGSALLAGGRWERAAAAGVLCAFAATYMAEFYGPEWRRPEYPVMAVDAALFLWFFWVASRSSRWWPVWAAAAQAAAVLSHLSAVMIPGYPRELYLTLQPAWAFPVLAAIAAGTRSELVVRRVERRCR